MRGIHSDDFVAYVCDLLAPLGTVRAKAMFGGYGLYVDETFCAIVFADTLYFKADERNRADYEALDCAPFKPFRDKPVVLSYYEVPAEVMDRCGLFRGWAAKALAAGRAAARGRVRRTGAQKARSLAPSGGPLPKRIKG